MLLPKFRDLDRLSLAHLTLRRHPLFIGVIYHSLEEVGLDCVDDIEEIVNQLDLPKNKRIDVIQGVKNNDENPADIDNPFKE